MYANYHTHTPRCKHAEGTPREYVETAIRNGIKILGFSDHVPYPFDGDYVSPVKMDLEEAADYVRELAALREEYRDRIRILIGYEAEYYPKHFRGMLDHIGQYECDYLILGQHFLDDEALGVYNGARTFDRGRLRAYVNQVLEALSTGRFSCLAHPDLINYQGDREIYQREMRRLCEGAKRAGVPLEINLLGLMQNRNYPNDRFWPLAKEVGNEVILGCDAHHPMYVGKPELEREGRAYAERFGLELLDSLQLRRPVQ